MKSTANSSNFSTSALTALSKQAQNLPLYQPDREREVLENAERANPGPLSDAAIRRLFERIIDEARSAEREAMHSSEDSPRRDPWPKDR